MKLLVSVRSVAEALDAAEAGADFIDLKEPSAGALGALPLETTRQIALALRDRHPRCLISATVGDFAADAVEPVIERAAATTACGVDYVKVGLVPGAFALLESLARVDAAIVPVFIADAGLDDALIARALELPFSALMLDTAGKSQGSLLDRLPLNALAVFISQTRAQRRLSGLAGALRADDVPALIELAPDFVGFRSAVCNGPRTGLLDAGKVRALRAQMRLSASAAMKDDQPAHRHPHGAV